jgi:hypothetical protein
METIPGSSWRRSTRTQARAKRAYRANPWWLCANRKAPAAVGAAVTTEMAVVTGPSARQQGACASVAWGWSISGSRAAPAATIVPANTSLFVSGWEKSGWIQAWAARNPVARTIMWLFPVIPRK